ncbi:MAG: polymerase, archaea type [Methanobacterium sp.]|jgi:DNA polymerase I|uniref:DNA-directed DNA polymerase n=2 Tax=Methanobacterium sp. TaxID=2164 RepID=UPI0003C968D4|nr:polymerase, archaea type [Methanobacterium sp.]CDG64292.1 DNA polymerase [Methanobacterium sp. MB1]
MITKKFILLDVDYITRNREPTIRLFGKLLDENDQKHIIALDNSFKPYIYVISSDIDSCINELNYLELNLMVEIVSKLDNGKIREVLKITYDNPGDLTKLKEEIQNLPSVQEVREHDIPFERRYLIDNGLSPMNGVEVQGKVLSTNPSVCMFKVEDPPHHLEISLTRLLTELKYLSFTIEVQTPNGMPQVNTDPLVMISISTNQGLEKIYSTKKSSSTFVKTVLNEEELLNKFVETVKSEDPDIIVGYNSDTFDFPYIKERADRLGLSLKLGIDDSKIKMITVPRKGAMIKGRIHVDLYRITRRHLQLNTHTIRNVYKELFKTDPIDIPASDIFNNWDNPKRRETIFRYSLEYVKAIIQIGERMLPMSIELARIAGQTLFDIVRRGTGTQVKWHLIRKAYELGHILPNEPGKFERNVVGGYVIEPTQGLHSNICYFDYRSLYPSIIIAKNISPETLTQEGDEKTCHIAPEFGYKFKKKPLGFIPMVTSQILNERTRIKAMMKESTDPEEKQILNFRQEALKTLISTIYGLYNHPQYRWYCVEASEAITAWGKDYLMKAMEKAEKHGFKTVYADTDGFFVTYALDRG